MGSLLVTTSLDVSGGFTDESVQNSFAFTTDVAIDDTVLLDIGSAVISFFNDTAPGATHPVAYYIGQQIDRSAGACRIKKYDIGGHLDGTPHGSPIQDGTWTLGAGAAASPLPAQVAGVLTLRARNALTFPVEAAGGTRPRARHSGRLYLGPLSRQAANDTAGAESFPHSDFIADVLKSAEALQDNLADGDYAWGVWSRSDARIVPITRVEMADSWGTLRSRKSDPTVRTARTFAPVPSLILGA